LLGYYVGDKLHDAGSVGTGWDSRTARDLWQRLAPLENNTTPFDTPVKNPGRWSKRAAGSERWVQPTLVAEVEFAEWTADGVVRQASFRGLRLDKPATSVVREGGKTQASAPLPQLKITHPERVIDASAAITKADLVRYYASVVEWMLPHLQNRPVALVRAPDGIAGNLFFQKHAERTAMPNLTAHSRDLWPKHPPLLTVDTTDALLSAARLNTVEFHTWNSVVRRLDAPDRVVFDLDPGEGVKWNHIQEAAMLVRTLLSELGLKAWLKTSGGKGLHVVVPLNSRLDYTKVKSFSQSFVISRRRFLSGSRRCPVPPTVLAKSTSTICAMGGDRQPLQRFLHALAQGWAFLCRSLGNNSMRSRAALNGTSRRRVNI
jgi:bifunctional non-homologous end joining protein LigD